MLNMGACTSLQDTASDTYIQEPDPSPEVFVDSTFLWDHLHVLAHDTLEGRGTGQIGAEKAADYLYNFYTSADFQKWDDLKVNRQPFTLEGIFLDAISAKWYQTVDGDTVYQTVSTLKNDQAAPFYPIKGGAYETDAPVIFAGYDPFCFDDDPPYADEESWSNSWIMVFENCPEGHGDGLKNSRTKRLQRINGYFAAAGIIIIPDKTVDEWEGEATELRRQLNRPLSVRRDRGGFRTANVSSGVAISIHPGKALKLLGLSHPSELEQMRNQAINPEIRDELHDTGYHLKINPNTQSREFTENNIITVLPGDHKAYSEEVVVLSAHYDHMGLGEPDDYNDIIYNGADDNASGSVVLMQIAEAFRKAYEQGYRPSRTLVFLHSAAEEWGIIGSRYFVENPAVPLENIVANVNVDMVGYVDDRYAEKDDSNYIYVIGAGMVSSELESLVDETEAILSDVKVDYTYNDTSHPMSLYRRSDQWAFGEQGIPFVFFFSGLHDYYHTPSDTADRIAWSSLERRAEWITYYVWNLVESPERPSFNIQKWNENQMRSR